MNEPRSSVRATDLVVDSSKTAPLAPAEANGLSRAQVESSYRRYAPFYDLLFGRSLQPGRTAMTKLVNALAPRDILEVGVGTGLTLYQYPATSRITGVDVSTEMLAVANRRVRPGDEERITLRAMDGETMDFADSSFDCVTLPYVLSVTPHPDRLVAEVRRVCRPGGHIVIVNHFSGQPPWRAIERTLKPLSAWLGFRSEFSVEHNVLRHDWKVESITPTNIFSLSRLIHVRNG